MTDLKSVSESIWRELNPNAAEGEVTILNEVVFEIVRNEYAYQMWQLAYAQMKDDGFSVPSAILKSSKISVAGQTASLSELNILRALPNDRWAVSLRGSCRYVRVDSRTAGTIDAADLPYKRYQIFGDEIKILDDTKDKEIEFEYASAGNFSEGYVISDEMAGMVSNKVRSRIQPGKSTPNLTENQNPDL